MYRFDESEDTVWKEMCCDLKNCSSVLHKQKLWSVILGFKHSFHTVDMSKQNKLTLQQMSDNINCWVIKFCYHKVLKNI